MKRFQVQQVDESGNVVQESVSDDVLLEELAERTKQIDDTIRDSEEPEAPLAESSVGTVIILTKVKGPRAEYVTEVYPGKMGDEPWKGAGTGFYAGGAYYRTSDEGRSWRNLRLKAAQPVEVGGKDVRTLPLPIQESIGTKVGRSAAEACDKIVAAAMMEEVEPLHANANCPRPPASEQKVQPRPTLDVAIERYGNLDVGIQKYLERLESWVLSGAALAASEQSSFDALVGVMREQWDLLGKRLVSMSAAGTIIKVTNRSRREAWMRPGAEVSLREDVFKRFLAAYPCEVLERLTIKSVTESDVFLVSGDRELGLVPKAHIVKRGQRGKSEASTAK